MHKVSNRHSDRPRYASNSRGEEQVSSLLIFFYECKLFTVKIPSLIRMTIKNLSAFLIVLLATVVLPSCVERTEVRRENCGIKVGIVFDIGG